MGKKAGNDKKKKKSAEKEKKLKPKQQWDRYSEFKREPKIHVGVRIKGDDSSEWMEVGRVKSKDSQYTEAAVFRQRAIIAEVSLRLLSDFLNDNDLAHCERRIPFKMFMGIVHYSVPSIQNK